MSHSTPERVVLYARVSTDMQVEEGLSIAAQLAEMREFAAQRGWSIVAEFVDPGVTGRTLDRPGLKQLLTAAEEHSFDVILVHELSRLSRSVFDTFAFFESLGRYNVGFASLKEPQFDLSTPTGRLLLTFIAGINQYYIDMLRMHTKKSKRQRVRQGLCNASIPPYGYRHVGDPKTPPAIVEEEAEAVRLAFERYATGQYSYQGIADLLNDTGYRTRLGRRFSKDTVADIIRNPFYAGKVVYKEGRRGSSDEVYPGLHKPVVAEEIWNAACRVRGRHQHASRTFQPQLRPYLLSRISHCHACGRNLRVQSASGGGYYREMSYARGYDDCPNTRVGVRAETVHRQISAIVRKLRLPPAWQEELARIIGDDEETISLRNRRARLIARRRRLKEAYIHGDFEEDEDIYRRELEQIRRELDDVPADDDLLRICQAAEVLESLADVWDDADAFDRRDLIRLMLRDVRVDVVQGRVLFLRPVAPFVPLFRSIPLLQERDLGTFTPVWTAEMTDLLPYPIMPPLTSLPRKVADRLFLPVWPWTPDPSARISEPLSDALKARRKAGRFGGAAIDVARRGVPPLLLDARKWPDASLEVRSLSEALEQRDGTLAFLYTPLAVQGHPDRDDLVEAAFRLLDEEGHWHVIDVVPASMPAHWVFAFFPEAWPHAYGSFWTAYNFYNELRRAGFQVKLREHAFYWPVALGVAWEIARRRSGLLAALTDEHYQEGLHRLEKALEETRSSDLIDFVEKLTKARLDFASQKSHNRGILHARDAQCLCRWTGIQRYPTTPLE
jgi:site-specific DNA recombinase